MSPVAATYHMGWSNYVSQKSLVRNFDDIIYKTQKTLNENSSPKARFRLETSLKVDQS